MAVTYLIRSNHFAAAHLVNGSIRVEFRFFHLNANKVLKQGIKNFIRIFHYEQNEPTFCRKLERKRAISDKYLGDAFKHTNNHIVFYLAKYRCAAYFLYKSLFKYEMKKDFQISVHSFVKVILTKRNKAKREKKNNKSKHRANDSSFI